MSLAYEAMVFAREAHKNQARKYTGNPYSDHLAEVVGIAMSVCPHLSVIPTEEYMAVAWLHDCLEDTHVSYWRLGAEFGLTVANSVGFLSDLENGNRAERKAASRERLSKAPSWVQTIKVADLISNTSSIVQHDPKFAEVYLEEKRLLLDVLTGADKRLVKIAREQIGEIK